MLCSCTEPEKFKLRIDFKNSNSVCYPEFLTAERNETLIQNPQSLPWGAFYNTLFYESQTKSSVKKWSSCQPPPAEHLENVTLGPKTNRGFLVQAAPYSSFVPTAHEKGCPRLLSRSGQALPTYWSSSALQTLLFPPASTIGSVELFYTTRWEY